MNREQSIVFGSSGGGSGSSDDLEPYRPKVPTPKELINVSSGLRRAVAVARKKSVDGSPDEEITSPVNAQRAIVERALEKWRAAKPSRRQREQQRSIMAARDIDKEDEEEQQQSQNAAPASSQHRNHQRDVSVDTAAPAQSSDDEVAARVKSDLEDAVAELDAAVALGQRMRNILSDQKTKFATNAVMSILSIIAIIIGFILSNK